MPFVQNQGAKLYWDELGSGEPLLLIMGLSYPSYMWHRTRPILAERYRTIALDNRGIGQSDVPPGVYSIALMASDAAAVLDAAGVETAHVFGVSMGGMIAQEFALQYPGRVRSLILGCTAAGGPHAVKAEPAALQTLTRRDLTPEESKEAIIPFIYDAATPPERIDEDMAIRMKWYPTPQGYAGQLQGIFSWEKKSLQPHRPNHRADAGHSRRNRPAHSTGECQVNRRAYSRGQSCIARARQPHFRDGPARRSTSRNSGISRCAAQSRKTFQGLVPLHASLNTSQAQAWLN